MMVGSGAARGMWLLTVGLLVVGLAGCGSRGSSSRGPSFAELVAQAQADPDPESRVERLIDLGRQQTAGQDILGAEETFALASKACQEVRGHARRAELYTALSQALLDSGARGAARKAAADAATSAATLEDAEEKAAALTAVAVAQHGLGDSDLVRKTLDQAELTAREIEDEEAAVRALATIAQMYQAKLGNTDENLRLLNAVTVRLGRMKDPADKLRGTLVLADAQHRSGQMAAAEASYEDAIKMAQKLETPLGQVYGLAAVAEQLIQNKRKTAAVKVLELVDPAMAKITEVDLQQQAKQKLAEVKRQLN